MKKFSREWWQSLPPEKSGKETEKLVESLFTEWNSRQSFAWHRLPDSKSARAFLKAQPASAGGGNAVFRRRTRWHAKYA